jgi:SAM-dependent methyltransferase
MRHSDDENIGFTESQEAVDLLNQEFYGRFPYPWPPMSFPRLDDPSFETVMLNQSIGDWKQSLVPERARIWVAGCGTNQAVYTALRFPAASITASDVSTASLEIGSRNARDFGLTNVSFRQESLNNVSYADEFDYILCTGVVHHNADPKTALGNISRALKHSGVLELMVYNRYHRTFYTAIQKAVRLFSRTDAAKVDFEDELKIAKTIIASGPISEAFRAQAKDWPEAALADAVLQPVEYSYTVESLCDLAAACGLELRLPCFNQIDEAVGRSSWNLRFTDAGFQQRFDHLEDSLRWQLTNLLLLEKSPMLWFFLQRAGRSRQPQFEWQVCEEFLQRTFTKTQTRLRNYVKQPNQTYQLAKVAVPFPRAPLEERIRAIVEAAAPNVKMRDILKRLGVDADDHGAVNEVRIQTTTSLCPYLRAVE